MTTSPQRQREALAAAAGAAVALGPAIWLHGFTVDDALITARYAAHLARGLGYRFNAGGPVTDGVTPLGWAHALAPFAGGGPLGALAAAKGIGVVAWVAAAAALGVAVQRASDRPIRFAALALVAASAPLGAWSAAGMETGVALALGALAAALPPLGRPVAGAACAGVLAGLRPEALPFALVLAAAAGWAGAGEGAGGGAAPGRRGAGGAGGAAARVAVAAAPFLAAACVRWIAYGRAAPLSALAKAPDAALGARYALACLLLTGPVALIAPVAFLRLPAWPRGLLAAVAAHFAAVALAGGDWMPLSRLVVPALPAAALGAAHVASVVDARLAAARLALALAGELFVTVRVGPTAARVGEDRLRVIEELGGALRGARVGAALDVGWLGAATDATLVDLAGVTDPAIAALPGGHTTKRIPPGLLDARGADALVLLLAEGEELRTPWTESRFARGVEQYVAGFPHLGEELAVAAVGSVPHLRYVVLRRAAAPP
ncbi:MAG: hypothetical protein IT372_03880 [Polyangiaceae bacterium]|nr:hypothetical protein [Polyangiaceae bacterium]